MLLYVEEEYRSKYTLKIFIVKFSRRVITLENPGDPERTLCNPLALLPP